MASDVDTGAELDEDGSRVGGGGTRWVCTSSSKRLSKLCSRSSALMISSYRHVVSHKYRNTQTYETVHKEEENNTQTNKTNELCKQQTFSVEDRLSHIPECCNAGSTAMTHYICMSCRHVDMSTSRVNKFVFLCSCMCVVRVNMWLSATQRSTTCSKCGRGSIG